MTLEGEGHVGLRAFWRPFLILRVLRHCGKSNKRTELTVKKHDFEFRLLHSKDIMLNMSFNFSLHTCEMGENSINSY